MNLFPREHRRLMPPVWAWVWFVIAGLIAEMPAGLIVLWYGFDSLVQGHGIWTVSIIAGLSFATWRIGGFHPAVWRPYRTWLQGSRWQPGEALPLGPVQLTWTDLAVLILISVPGLFFRMPGSALVGFLIAWTLGNAAVFYRLRMIRTTLLIMFLLGLAPIVFVALKIVGEQIGIPDSLAPFLILLPVVGAMWFCNFRLSESLLAVAGWNWMELDVGENDVNIGKAGWPVIDLSTMQPMQLPFGKPDVILVSLTIGWLCYGIGLSFQYLPNESGSVNISFSPVLFMVPSVVLGMLRICVYLARVRPPISMWGRVVVGPLVQWKFDRVFVMPVLSVLVAFVLLVLGSEHLLPMELAFACSVVASMLINGLGGPDLATFRLTGTHRFSLPMIQSAETVTLGSSQPKLGRS